MAEVFTVIMRDVIFVLTRQQIEVDSPNWFTTCFLGEYIEERTRTVTLSRSPELFRIILDHLSNYQVLPLHSSMIPQHMSAGVALENLLEDAKFYSLNNLIERINAYKTEHRHVWACARPSFIMLTRRITMLEVPVWANVPISEETAIRMREKYGLDNIVAASTLTPWIQGMPLQVRAPATSFLVEAIWCCTLADWQAQCVILRLVY